MCGGKVAIPPIVKEKRRNSEKRKEKSRDAARCRRSKESEIFSDLSGQLPLAPGVASALDKASIMRLTVGYLKVREMMKILIPCGRTVTGSSNDSIYAAVLNGFLLVLSEEGDIIYLSENVEEFIGISQVDMMGHSVYDFSHPCDHEDIKQVLAPKISEKIQIKTDNFGRETISFFVRMKSTVKSKGRTMNLKSAAYQVIHYIGHRFDKPRGVEDDDKCPTFYLVFIGKTIPHPAQIDVPLDKDIFVSRHSPDMKFTHIDERISEFLGFTNSELIGQSAYSFHHPLDAQTVFSAFKTLFSKGQCETGYYRFLSKYGGYVWLVTQATVIYENGTKPECVVCLNYVLSKVENGHEIVSGQQEQSIKEKEEAEDENICVAEEEGSPSEPPVLLSSTRVIFAPKESVMSKDFLNFPDADVLFQESLKDTKLNLEFDFFQDDPCTLENGISEDPFISYRDDSLSSPSYCGTPESSLNLHTSNSTSPDRFNTTPGTPDSGSLSDIPSLDPIDEFSNLDLKFTMPPSASDDSECCDENLDFRAPYISMNMDDDFPLISPSSSVMWGPQEPAPKKLPQERLPEIEPQRISPPKQKPVTENLNSSLAALLQSDVKKTPQSKQEKNAVARRESNSHKRWSGSSADNNKSSSLKQRPFNPSKGYGNGGHIIMLDSIPVKKQNSKSNASQRRTAQPSASDRRSNSPPFGSHTATVKVNDRLIKVQVSVSELPTSPIEHKQPFPSPPDPPPKRTSPSRLGPTESPKRLKVDNGLICSGPQGFASDSVLLNLLISGEDASRGYLCSGNSRYSDSKFESAMLSLSSDDSSSKQTNDSSSNCTELLASESELLDFLKISQYDAEVNAPIQSSHLLQGDDLLSALDHQPLLRNVPALV
ncbi:hypoxia-inducible factor 1-alpha-like isoform X2 [Stegodyphus dumicola]|uniref:hypoxia-inducible factor 1-alpha-like isoform X2 n=1 Tax=Stegodyphus dumicola TaxID=202533 RepID=UPI0015AF20B8|nr:hypoxia-inducible factor 1-alpha-like isoform X2 [Stegodyphus dumicola]